ncbi:MAG: hypothetical protein A3J51_03020 [Omnitrophica WOR_2 bacterium RIFCSPHIGHO2_02_FULL_45_21]|nr:MAG: hypothetical protein A3J51_03020 [Omnitrophica WOR_2 bacterium RIFCSPHIGHO2_02_FULL_45_21]
MKKRIFLIISLAYVLSINLYFRSFTIAFPQLKLQAKDITEKTIQQAAIQEVQKRFPQFYPTAKDEILRTRITEYKKYNKENIKNQIQNLYHQLKDKFQDASGQTYLMELDCWHWGRYVENVVRFGHPGDEIIFGKQWDLLMLAPQGSFLHWDQFLFYFSAFLYKCSPFFKAVHLFTFLFYIPLFFTAIFIIVLYFFSFRYGGYLGGILSCLFTGLAPIFIQRSHAGWFDKDVLNLLLPLLVVWTYILASVGQSLKRKLFWICFSAFWVGLFCFNWTQWWFVFLIIIIYEFIFLGGYLFSYLFLKKENGNLMREHGFSLCLFILCSLLWIAVLAGTQPLVVLYNQITQALTLNRPLMASIWPNVYATVGELRSMTIAEISHLIGNGIFAASVFSLFTLLVRALFSRRYPDFKRISVIILAIWFVCMVFASFRGVRFVVFLLIPLGISLGWMLNDLFQYFKNKKNVWMASLVIMAFVILNAFCVSKAYGAARYLFPLMDDTWHNVLNLIKEKTSPETILNSWWDFGDWFKVAARRRVTFDGQSQGMPQAYWMAKALLTSDEKRAVGILRMLNNGGNKAFETIDKQLKDPLLSVLLLESVLGLPPENAQGTLLKFLPAQVAQEVMGLLYATPSRAGFIVDYTMLGKMTAISYLGDWNFSKVYIAQNFDKSERDKIIDYLKNLGINESQIQQFYQEVFLISTKKLDDWLSYRLQYYSPLINGHEKNGVIFFDNGFIYVPKEKTIQSNTGQIPRSLFTLADDTLVENVYPNANSVFSALVYKTEDNMYKCILLDRDLGLSIFTRLYFLRGKSLKHFIPFIDAEEGNNYIRCLNIIW